MKPGAPRVSARVLLFLLLCVAVPPATSAQPRMTSVGDRRVAVYCDGDATRAPTVVLVPAAGRTVKDWEQVQPAVSKFARVCSYDHAGVGASDAIPVKLQSVDEAVEELHAWIDAAGERRPVILVTHSGAGIYARRFTERYPGETAGLLFVDSSHEEQALRLRELDPKGPGLDDFTARLGFYVKRGERLEWRTELPLIVIGRGQPTPRRARDGSDSHDNRMTEEQFAEWDRIWRGFQEDLAKRSPRGEFRLAARSGHFIQRDQPELVIEAIRDLVRR